MEKGCESAPSTMPGRGWCSLVDCRSRAGALDVTPTRVEAPRVSEPTTQSAVDEVRHALSRPLFNPVLKVWVGEGKLDYEVYLRTGDLLQLQTPRTELVAPDELMFQVVHQAQEIWLKLLA